MKNVQNIILATVCSLVLFTAKAQQIPLVSQYFYSPMLYNPALAGKNEEVNIWLMDREQWVKVKGAPSTRGGTVDAGLWKNRMGVGLTIFNDQTDIINRFMAQVTVSGKVKLFKDAHLAIGLTPSIMDVKINFQKANPEVINDPNLFSQVQNRVTFDMNAGLAFTWRNLIVGFSIPQVLNSRARYISALNQTDMSLTRHYIGHASYKFEFAKKRFFLQPMALVKFTQNAPVQAEGNLIFGYKNIVWAGAGYRSGNGVMAMAGVGIANIVTIGYAFDYHLNNRVMSQLGSSHEVVLGIRIGYGGNKKNKELEESIAKIKRLDNLVAQNTEDIDTIKANMLIEKGRVDNIAADVEQYKTKLNKLDNDVQSANKLIEDMRNAKNTEDVLRGDKTNKPNIYKLDGVFFETNSSFLTKGSYDQLDRLAELLKDKPNLTLRILGHTDYIASDEYNQWLSERRAKSVQEYLAKKGVSPERLTAIGYGKKVPVASNETEEGRAKNRRVEIEVEGK